MSQPARLIASMVVFAADNAVLDQRDKILTRADQTRVAVEAAIDSAIRNGLVVPIPNLEERLKDGITLRFADDAKADSDGYCKSCGIRDDHKPSCTAVPAGGSGGH